MEGDINIRKQREKGTGVCECGKRISTYAKHCVPCSLKSGNNKRGRGKGDNKNGINPFYLKRGSVSITSGGCFYDQ